jgi:hypothetical protein
MAETGQFQASVLVLSALQFPGLQRDTLAQSTAITALKAAIASHLRRLGNTGMTSTNVAVTAVTSSDVQYAVIVETIANASVVVRGLRCGMRKTTHTQ